MLYLWFFTGKQSKTKRMNLRNRTNIHTQKFVLLNVLVLFTHLKKQSDNVFADTQAQVSCWSKYLDAPEKEEPEEEETDLMDRQQPQGDNMTDRCVFQLRATSESSAYF